MKPFGRLAVVAVVALSVLTSVAHAYEYDSNSVGYTDYGPSSYFRDKCTTKWQTSKVNGLRTYTRLGYFMDFSGRCQAGGFTTRLGAYGALATQDLWCSSDPNGNFGIDGLRGYSDANGVTSVGISCNNGSYSTNLPTMSGTVQGPYYNSVRCASGSVAWGLWTSVNNPIARIGRVGMICNGWWEG